MSCTCTLTQFLYKAAFTKKWFGWTSHNHFKEKANKSEISLHEDILLLANFQDKK